MIVPLARLLADAAPASLDDERLARLGREARALVMRALLVASAPDRAGRSDIMAMTLEALREQLLARGRAVTTAELAGVRDALSSGDDPAALELARAGPEVLGALHELILEYELAVATRPLVAAGRGHRAARAGERVDVEHGGLYLSRTADARKRAGVYFTPDLAIAHLLDHALEPALEEHARRLDALPDDDARAAALFDLRVADLSMGAGHFLRAAADRIARRLSAYLRDRVSVGGRLGDIFTKIKNPRSLRVAVAERCVYGVDIDPETVALARWGLGLGAEATGRRGQLLVGDALLGVATPDELARLLAPYDVAAEWLRARAREGPRARAACELAVDLLIAERASPSPATRGLFEKVLWGMSENASEAARARARAREVLGAVKPLHLPLALPSLFSEGRAGFDVIVGNPPWEEVTVEADRFWSRWSPGLQALPQREREREIAALRARHPERQRRFEAARAELERRRRALLAGPFPGLGTGDPDLYKAFTWRLLALTRAGGRIGVVLPRNAFVAKGSARWRRQLLEAGAFEELTFLSNRGGWVFRDVHPQYTIALATIRRPAPGEAKERGELALRGPFHARAQFEAARRAAGARVEVGALLGGSETAAFPLLPEEGTAAIWARMRRAPRLDLDEAGQWRARPCAELHATQDKSEMLFGTDLQDRGGGEGARVTWPVYKGGSFDLWRCDTGRHYARVDAEAIQALLQGRRLRASRRSPMGEFSKRWREDPRTLPCLAPRIAFRDVTRATDSRTMRAALVPGERVLANQAPYLLWPRGDARDVAYVLGVLCSIPFDWYARRFVETHMNFHVLNPAPVPRPSRRDPRWRRVVALAGRLAAVDDRFAGWAREVGVDCGPLSAERRASSIAELDALVARLYGLDAAATAHVFRTFHIGWDPGPRLRAALEFHRRWGD